MLQNHRPKLIQGLMLDLAPSRALQDESCAPAHAREERGIYAAESPIRGDPEMNPSIRPPRMLCRMNPALLCMRARSAAFMLQNDRPRPIQRLIPRPNHLACSAG